MSKSLEEVFKNDIYDKKIRLHDSQDLEIFLYIFLSNYFPKCSVKKSIEFDFGREGSVRFRF